MALGTDGLAGVPVDGERGGVEAARLAGLAGAVGEHRGDQGDAVQPGGVGDQLGGGVAGVDVVFVRGQARPRAASCSWMAAVIAASATVASVVATFVIRFGCCRWPVEVGWLAWVGSL